ncbi:MAG: hypothetical protein HEQ32_00225 [Vampirovibrio sp.]
MMTLEFAMPAEEPHMALGLSREDYNAFVQEMLQVMKNRREQRQEKERIWQACWKAYRCEMDAPRGGSPEGNLVARPVVFQAVENLHNTIMSQLFPKSGRFFHVFGQRQEDQQDASMLETLLHHKLAGQGFQSAFGLFLKQLLVTGNSVMMMPWYYEKSKKVRQVPIKRLGLTVGYTRDVQDVLVEQGPRFELLNIQDVYIDEALKDWREGSLIRRIRKTLAQVLQEPRYVNTAILSRQMQDQRRHQRPSEALTLQQESITLLEIWGDFSINEKVYPNHVAVIVEETGTVLRFEAHGLECGQAPFVVGSLIPVPHEGYGIGAVEKSLGLQHAINTLTNQKLDILNLCINTPFTYLLNDDIFDPLSMDYRPGALIPVKNHDTLRPLPLVAQNISIAFQEIEDLKIEILETTGSLRLMTGALEGSNAPVRTATEVNTLTANAHRKYDGMLMQLEQECLEPMLQLVYELAKQFWVYPEEIRLLEKGSLTPRYETMTPDVFQRSCCDIRVLGSRGQLKEEQELESLLFFVKTMQDWPNMLPRLNMEAIVKRMIRHLGFKDEELLTELPPAV